MGKQRGPEKGGIRAKDSKLTQYRSTWGLTTSTKVSWPCWKSPETKQVTNHKSQVSIAWNVPQGGGSSGKLQLTEGFYPLLQARQSQPHTQSSLLSMCFQLVVTSLPFLEADNLSPRASEMEEEGQGLQGCLYLLPLLEKWLPLPATYR